MTYQSINISTSVASDSEKDFVSSWAVRTTLRDMIQPRCLMYHEKENIYSFTKGTFKLMDVFNYLFFFKTICGFL